MKDIARIVCPHGVVATFVRHDGFDWGAVITATESVRDGRTGDFIGHRYPIRCRDCRVTADATHDKISAVLDAAKSANPIVDQPLSLIARLLGDPGTVARLLGRSDTP